MRHDILISHPGRACLKKDCPIFYHAMSSDAIPKCSLKLRDNCMFGYTRQECLQLHEHMHCHRSLCHEFDNGQALCRDHHSPCKLQRLGPAQSRSSRISVHGVSIWHTLRARRRPPRLCRQTPSTPSTPSLSARDTVRITGRPQLHHTSIQPFSEYHQAGSKVDKNVSPSAAPDTAGDAR